MPSFASSSSASLVAACLLGSSILLQGAVATPVSVVERQTVPYLTVKTETALTWCRPYADEMGDVVTYYYEPTSINVTCWGYTTMFDSKGEVDGDPVWLKQDTGCWINENYVQGGDLDFMGSLKQCTAPPHQVGFPKDSYYVSGQGVPCYNGTTNTAAKQYVTIGYVDLGCSKVGSAVNGNSTWVKWQKGECYFPGDTFDPAEFHGYSLGQC